MLSGRSAADVAVAVAVAVIPLYCHLATLRPAEA